jgi:hypothetical protein
MTAFLLSLVCLSSVGKQEKTPAVVAVRTFLSVETKDLNNKPASLPRDFKGNPTVCVFCFGLDHHTEATRFQKMKTDVSAAYPSLEVYEIQIRQTEVQQPPPAVVDPLLALVDPVDVRSRVFPIYVDKVSWSKSAGITVGCGPYVALIRADGAISSAKLTSEVNSVEDFTAFLKSN